MDAHNARASYCSRFGLDSDEDVEILIEGPDVNGDFAVRGPHGDLVVYEDGSTDLADFGDPQDWPPKSDLEDHTTGPFAKDEVTQSIEAAEVELALARYRALHNRLEDYTTWLIEMGYLAKKAIGEPLPGERSSDDEYLFELVEEYLDGANEEEDCGPLDQILNPDLDEGVGEPDVETHGEAFERLTGGAQRGSSFHPPI